MMGRLTALSRFLPKLIEKTRLIVKSIKKSQNFEWEAKCEEVFCDLKKFLATPLIQIPQEFFMEQRRGTRWLIRLF